MSAVTDALRYDGYGATIDSDGSFGSPWKFQGALDVAPGSEPLYDIGAREYAPSFGAFTSLDSVVGSATDPRSMNRFLYAEANPTTMIDPSGHKPCTSHNDEDCDSLRGLSEKQREDTLAAWYKEAERQHGKCGGDCGHSHTGSAGGANRPAAPSPAMPISLLPRVPAYDLGDLDCSIERLDCTLDDFNRMTASQRIAWIKEFDETYAEDANIPAWHNNIVGFLQAADQLGWIKSGSGSADGNWFSWTDAGILQGIQDGMGLFQGRITGSQNPGASLWSDFYKTRAEDRPNASIDLAKHMWGVAEQASTDYGQSIAFGRGKLPSVQQYAVGILWGNAYRASTSNPGVTRGIGQGIGGVPEAWQARSAVSYAWAPAPS